MLGLCLSICNEACHLGDLYISTISAAVQQTFHMYMLKGDRSLAARPPNATI